MLIGVLAMQGAFREHRLALEACGATCREIRKPAHLEGLDGLVIPGGESTTIGKLLHDYELFVPIREMGKDGLPIFGTCAGLVMLARDIEGSNQPRLGLMDICVIRNAFGRQVHSFEADLSIPALGEAPFPGVFIRAPYINKAGEGVEVLAVFQDHIVMARQQNLLVTAFHPELTGDQRVHRYFLHTVAGLPA